MARKQIKGKPGLFGMVYYYDENGNPVGKSRPGLIKGTRVYTNQNGSYAGKSRPGFFSKEVYTDTDNDCITTFGAPIGDIHFENGTPIGHSTPGMFGTSYTSLDTEDKIYEDEFCEDETDCLEEDFTKMPYEDSEDQNNGEHTPQTPSPNTGKKTNSSVLFLVICAAIICIYAVIK